MLLIHMDSEVLFFFSTPTQNYKEKRILCSTINPYLAHGLLLILYFTMYFTV